MQLHDSAKKLLTKSNNCAILWGMEGAKSNSCTTIYYVGVPLSPSDRERLAALCGRGRSRKVGAWVAEAIVAALDREEARERRP